MNILIYQMSSAVGLPLPSYATVDAAGMDLQAAHSAIIPPDCRYVVGTGLIMAIPMGFELQIRPRSGMAVADGITVLNSPGTIDSDYRGEIKIVLYNTGSEEFRIERGRRIAQAVVAPVYQATFTPVDYADILPITARGTGGFGSTGI